MKNKILILLFILSFSFCFFDCKVAHGAEIPGFVQSKIVENKGYSSETDCYDIYYRYYKGSRLVENTISIPKNIYELDHWYLEGGVVYPTSSDYVEFPSSENPDMYRSYYARYTDGSWERKSSKGVYLYKNDIEGFLFCKDVVLGFRYGDKVYGLSELQNNFALAVPTTQYVVNTGIRLKLNGFCGYTDIVGVSETIRSLNSVKLSVTALDAGSVVVGVNDVLASYDVQGSPGNFYIDVPFGGAVLPNLNTTTRDYLIKLTYNMTVTRNGTGEDNYLSNSATFSHDVYAKYSYKADTNSGILIDSDENGNEIDHGGGGGGGDTPSTSPTPTATSNATEEAIKDQTVKIEEQTNAIKEQTEVSKNIFQQIIELPR